MPNYKEFNDFLEKTISFDRLTPVLAKLGYKAYDAAIKCGILKDNKKSNNISELGLGDTNIYSYKDWCKYIKKLTNAFKKCNDRQQAIRFANLVLSIDELYYEYFLKDCLINKDEQGIGYLDRDNYMVEKNICRLFLKNGDIDSFFEHNSINNYDIVDIIIENKKCILDNLPYQKSSLVKLRDLLEQWKTNNIIDFEDESNKTINKIKEISQPLILYIIPIEDDKNTEQQVILRNFIKSYDNVNKEDAKEFIRIIRCFVEKYNKLNKEKCEKAGKDKLDLYYVVEKLKMIFKQENKLEFVDEILNSVECELQNRENTYVKSILCLSSDCSNESKEDILRNFFKLGYSKTDNSDIRNSKFGNIVDLDYLIDKTINKIINNDILVNQIISGENLFKKMDEMNISIDDELKGDYTFFVAAQIKSIERFIKESILKNLSGETLYTSNNSYLVCNNKNLDELTESDALYKVELGSLDIMLNNRLIEESSNNQIQYIFEEEIRKNINNSVFYYWDPKYDINGKHHTAFYTCFVHAVRNGHFHTSYIDSIADAKKMRENTAFWLMCVIDELKGL
ncbi:MAG: hypothetical protein J5656_05015 [Clostridia bacterium]|nr:hypothetical protein [Clostridia bacterium]